LSAKVPVTTPGSSRTSTEPAYVVVSLPPLADATVS
jgi:hypothetical protein